MKDKPFAGARVRLLFVCLGNICRSPLAEGVFRRLVREAGLEDRFEIASAGTGDWHVGQPADQRMRRTAAARGLTIEEHRGRQFQASDFERYDLILVMDRDNLHDVLYLDPDESFSDSVRLFREFDPEPGDYQVPDPYFGGPRGFDEVYEIVERTGLALLEALVAHYRIEPRAGRRGT